MQYVDYEADRPANALGVEESLAAEKEGDKRILGNNDFITLHFSVEAIKVGENVEHLGLSVIDVEGLLEV